MKLRVHIEFLGLTSLRVTKFSAQKVIQIKDIINKSFDFDSFSITKDTVFYMMCYGGNGTPNSPHELEVFRKNHDGGHFESIGYLHATDCREITVEARV